MGSVESKFGTKLNKRLADALSAGVAFCLAYEIRFEGQVPASSAYQMWLLVGPVMLGQVLVNSMFGTYHLVWRYINLEDATRVARSYAAFSVMLLAAFFVAPERGAVLQIPRSIIVIQFLLSFFAALGARALWRILCERMPARKKVEGERATRVVLIGAGRAGVMVAREIAARTDFRVVGFLDDDPQKKGFVIGGLRVLGPVKALPSIAQEHQVTEVVVCIPRVPQAVLRRVWTLCDELAVRIRIVPAFEEILRGKINITAFRGVEMSDLLGRERVGLSLEPDDVAAYQGRRILITGAGGSIGSELAFQLARLRPAQLALLDKDENSLHEVCVGMASRANGTGIHPVVADLRFSGRLRAVLSSFQPEVIFHAAAHKHVHLMEANPCEAILNNVTGTHNLIEQSAALGISRFILISTDKAVKPTSIMGASKRVCEMIAQAQRDHGQSRFCCVRFGNVLGSRGSVVPLFQKQIAHGEAVTVTHADAERYLMTIPEAVGLLIQAGTLGSCGEIFVLDMGWPVRIRELARDLIELSGLRPGKDVPIHITQLHRGEKVHEQLYDEATEELLPTRFSQINVIRGRQFNAAEFAEKLSALEQAALREAPQDVFRILRALNIGFQWEGMAESAESRKALPRVAAAGAGK